jgi:hypothetical protein
MTIVEKRSAEQGIDYVVEDRHISATMCIYVGLAAALAIYILGSAVLLQDVGGGAPRRPGRRSSVPDDAGLGGRADP